MTGLRVAGERRVVLLAALLVMILRLPFVGTSEGSDEGGYLAVAQQWHAGGPSLYSHYWVDRPPLLIAIFQLASALGGLPGLRVIGAVAAALAVVGAASAVRQVAGARAAGWTAVVTGVLLACPLLGTVQVNGELLAAPFIAAGIAAAIAACHALGAGRARWCAFGTGACAVAALLVKQNMAEVFVFALVSWLVSGRRRPTLFVSAAAGALASLLVVGGWTVLHGSSLAGVYDATYPFRIKAAQVIAEHSGAADARRLHALLVTWALSGAPVVLLALAWALLRRRIRGAAAWGVLATIAYSTTSMLAGGGFWTHYLVEAVVPVSIAVGLLIGAELRLVRPAGVVIVAVAVVGWGIGLTLHSRQPGTTIGGAIGQAAQPGDSIISAFGDAETVSSSGLSSPYPYLWTLPAQTLDPRLTVLERTLHGPNAPTWFVSWDRPSFPRRRLEQLVATVHSRYRAVAEICGRSIYLRDGIDRPLPRQGKPCVEPSVLRIWSG
ncbi:MAG: hypothetical protein JWR35_1345 [Marmoricola sp.]|nr:hypothetical protein [Marmoricola sp.]